MKKLLLLVLGLFLYSCDYQSLEDRINQLENAIEENKNNYLILKEVQESQVSIASVTEVTNGFTIVFTNGESINISNGIDGNDGQTPYIGENGNWWISGVDSGVSSSSNSEEVPTLLSVVQDGDELIFTFSDGEEIRTTLTLNALSDIEELFNSEWDSFVQRFDFENGEYFGTLFGNENSSVYIKVEKDDQQFHYEIVESEYTYFSQTVDNGGWPATIKFKIDMNSELLSDGNFEVKYTLFDQVKFTNHWRLENDGFTDTYGLRMITYEYFNDSLNTAFNYEYDHSGSFYLKDENEIELDSELAFPENFEFGKEYLKFGYEIYDGYIYKGGLSHLPNDKIGAIGILVSESNEVTINYYSHDFQEGDMHPSITESRDRRELDESELLWLELDSTINSGIKYYDGKYNERYLLDVKSAYNEINGGEAFKYFSLTSDYEGDNNIWIYEFLN